MKKISIINTCIVIALIFVGAIIYANHQKSTADRAACILNIRNIHQAARAHGGLTNLTYGKSILDWHGAIFISPASPAGYLEEPTCPHDGSKYILSKTLSHPGVAMAICPHCNSLDHKPENTTGW